MSVAPASQRIWLDDVRCYLGSKHWTGEDPTKLHHCYHAGWGNNNCTHEEDVHLRCVEGLGMQSRGDRADGVVRGHAAEPLTGRARSPSESRSARM